MRFNITSIKERLALLGRAMGPMGPSGEPLTRNEIDFVLDCIDEATKPKTTIDYIHSPKNYMGRVEAIYAAFSVDEGGEGLCAGDFDGLIAALIGADKKRFDRNMKPKAQQIATASGKPVRIAKFTHREDIEILKP